MKFGYAITYVGNVAATVEFFRVAFGIAAKFVHEGGDYAELATGETALAFASFELADSNFPDGYTKLTEVQRPIGIEIALVTDDVGSAIQKAIASGATLVKVAMEKPWGQTVGYVRSPAGILIELCTPIA